MTPATLTAAAATAAALSALQPFSPSALCSARPNILVIMADDLNTDLGCYGNPLMRTPNIDRLAREGVLFQNANCQFPLCGPSRASIWTGQRPSRNGVTSNRHELREKSPDVVTLPQLFRRNGYFTARVGKIFHYTVPQEIGTDGHDDPPSWVARRNPKGRDVDDEDMIFSLIPGQISGTLSWLAAEGGDREQTDGMGAGEAVQFLRQFKKSAGRQPFFLAVGFFRPHTPFVAPKKYFDLHPLEKIPLPEVPSGHMEAGPAPAFSSSRPEQQTMTADLRRKAIQAYWASVSFMDAQAGLVLDELARLGLAENTIVVFMSDHGYHLGDHGLWQKGSLFERVARVPLVIRQPKTAAPGAVVKTPVELIDLYPTLAQLCGLAPPAGIDGKTLVPLLKNPAAPHKPAALTQVQRNKPATGPYIKDPAKRPPIEKAFDGYSIRTERYRYTEWDEGRQGVQLHDMENDPGELRNLAGDPQLRDAQARLRKTLHEMLKPAPADNAAAPSQEPAPVTQGKNGGRLRYAVDSRGNRVPDFSHCGYMAGDTPIPDAPVKITVAPIPGDNTALIQAAIDQVAAMPPDSRSLRGAVLLEKGRFEIAGALRITASGVVLRGSGPGPDGTLLVATGHDRRTLLEIRGKNDRAASGGGIAITDSYVPLNAQKLRLPSGHPIKTGDTLLIHRPSTREWLDALGLRNRAGLDPIPPGDNRPASVWRPGTRDIVWDRAVTAVDGDTITLDAPLTCVLDARFGGATVTAYSWPGRISNAGIENLACESTFDAANPKDEAHSWFGVTMDNARDSWARQLSFKHFAGSAVAVWESCRRVTVEDVKSLAPVSETGGWRRNTFFTTGQQVLMQRLYSEDGHHDFAVGFAAAGPNAFVQCESLRSTGESGALDSWACGALFDNVNIDGNALGLRNRGHREMGAQWAAANGMLWNCSAAVIECQNPPTARNWAVGTWGEYAGDGGFFGSNGGVQPRSLYYAQLADRAGAGAGERAHLMPPPSGIWAGGNSPAASMLGSPLPEDAEKFSRLAREAAPGMSAWIDAAPARNPIPATAPRNAARAAPPPPPPAKTAAPRQPLEIRNGWLVANGRLLNGARTRIPWCFGGARPSDLPGARTAITRFVPGRTGPGLTDDLPGVIAAMRAAGEVAVAQNPPLWYERRRDYHDTARRMDGDVVAPFYETPFARSGRGVAWDGLSKYDLSKYNSWYWDRLRDFATLAGEAGFALLYSHYFQHSLIEAGAHYVDFPWRAANNVNDVGFPEPANIAGNKRVFMAEQFYDLSSPVRRALHRALIRKALDTFASAPNVIHFTGAEYTGPRHFMEFWLDTIAEWERETGKKARVGLSCTKDVQDAILADPRRAAVVSLIDICHWWPQPDGSVHAPEGGKSLAPRQWERVLKAKPPPFGGIVKAVREYREKFPGKPVIYSGQSSDKLGWAVILGGGSLPQLNKPLPPRLAASIPQMKPLTLAGRHALGIPGKEYLIHAPDGVPAGPDLNLYTQQQVAKNIFWLIRK
jgi:arylsulfatase A-like enzyme